MKTAISTLLISLLFMGCSSKRHSDIGADAGAGDADSDTDADSDSDADSDAGSDAGADASTGCASDDTCLIGDRCYDDEAVNPDNACGRCLADTSPDAWTAFNESGPCGAAGVCSEGVCHDPWPPTEPWRDGGVCALPACDESMALPFDYSGNWTVSTTTTSTNCNLFVQMSDPRLQVGAVHTGNPHPLHFIGGCDYPPDTTTPSIGTFASNVEVTCEVNARPEGTTTVETSAVTFGDAGTAAGTATVYLRDLPPIALQPGNQCKVEMDVAMQRVPDCAGPSDCGDGLDCTTDSCDLDAGVCRHALEASHCVIDNACVDDGAFKSATGDGSCRKCVGAPPSQYGWMVLGSGEPCDDGNAGTSNDACKTGGICEGAI